MNDMTLVPAFACVSAIIYGLIIVLHVLPRFLKNRAGHALDLVCVGLHIPLMPMMLLAGFSLEVMILAYALSAFLHSVLTYVFHRLALKDKPDKEVDE